MKYISKNKKIYYGWIIVAAAFIIMATAWASVYNCSSLFIKPISEDLGFTRTEISATMTIRGIFQMIISFLSGKIFKKFNIIKLMRVCTITLVVSFFLYSISSSLIIFYLLTVIISVSVSLVCVLPFSLILSNWFIKDRGFAIGIAFMGSGVGGMILSPLVGNWIASFGWRFAYRALALIMLLTITPCTFFIVRTDPKDLGLIPYGFDDTIEPDNREEEYEGMMLRDAFRTIRFWTLCLSSIFLLIGVNTLVMSLSPHLTDIGYSIPFSANIVALTMGSIAVGKIILGKLFDNLGPRKAVTIACISTLSGLVGLVYANYYIALAVIVIFSGIGCAYGTVANPVLTVELYGKKDYSSIFGFLSAVGALGGIIGPILSGYLYDISGSYLISFKIFIVLNLISIILYQFIFINPKEKVEECHNN